MHYHYLCVFSSSFSISFFFPRRFRCECGFPNREFVMEERFDADTECGTHPIIKECNGKNRDKCSGHGDMR